MNRSFIHALYALTVLCAALPSPARAELLVELERPPQIHTEEKESHDVGYFVFSFELDAFDSDVTVQRIEVDFMSSVLTEVFPTVTLFVDSSADKENGLYVISEGHKELFDVNGRFTVPEDGFYKVKVASVTWEDDAGDIRTLDIDDAETDVVAMRGTSQVPEPGSAMLALVGICVAAYRRRRK